jgi:hypothetical protein
MNSKEECMIHMLPLMTSTILVKNHHKEKIKVLILMKKPKIEPGTNK